eukprot:m.282 g.282  ORF g.282 m.282 type:complete len:50 (-) comp223_c0_seq1:53-202(-)
MAELLLRAGADPTATTTRGLTARDVALRIGRAEAVVELVDTHLGLRLLE